MTLLIGAWRLAGDNGAAAKQPDSRTFILRAQGFLGRPLNAVEGTKSCCNEVRASVLTIAGSRWTVTDTVAVVMGSGDIHSISIDGPFRVISDSGSLGYMGDTIQLVSTAYNHALPVTWPIAIRRRDTLEVRTISREDVGFGQLNSVRIYVRRR